MAKQSSSARRRDANRGQENKIVPMVIGAVVVLVLAGLGYLVYDAVRPTEAIEGLVRFPEAAGNQHVQGDIYEFGELPPHGGPHDPRWQNCGVYDTPVRSENAVHSLEHGAAWVTYREDLPAEDVAVLADLVIGEPSRLLSPYPGQRSPVVLTTWAYQLEVNSVNDPRIVEFLERYTNDPLTTPERGATCAGGIGEPLDR